MRETTPIYRVLLKDAWRLSWNNKKLWLLGLLSAAWGVSWTQMISSFVAGGQMGWRNSARMRAVFSWESMAGFVLLVVLSVVILWLVTASRGGLLWAIREAHEGKDTTIQKSLTHGTARFWPVFLINIIGRWVLGGLFIAFGTLTLRGGTEYAGVFIGSFVLATIIGLAISFLTIFATMFAVLEKQTVIESWKNAWKLFTKHWLAVIETSCALYLIGVAVGLALIVTGFVIVVPFALLAFITSFLHSMIGFWFIIVPLGIILLALLVLVGALFSTFELATWELLFLRIAKQGIVPKAERVFLALRNRFWSRKA